MKKFNLVLLINDDGYDKYGIVSLKEKMKKYAKRVVICAPLNPMSAKSSSVTITHQVDFKKIDEDTYAINGTPCDCFLFAKYRLNLEYDLLISGCNDGPNISFDTKYSGTIGAASEGLTYNNKSIAFSSPYNDFKYFDMYFDEVFNYILFNNLLSSKYMLSVNFPRSDKEYQGIQITKLSNTNDYKYFYDVHFGDNIDNNKGVELEKCGDIYCYFNGIISITPLKSTFFHEKDYVDLLKKIK